MTLSQTHDQTYEIYINSSVDTTNLNDTLSQWTSYFDIPLEVAHGKYGLAVKSIAVCNTINQFNDKNNKFKINNNEYTVEIDRVYQSTTSLCSYLTSLVSSENIDFSVDIQTQRVRIENNSGTTKTIDLTGNYLNFWKKLGFKYDTNTQPSSVDINNTLLKHVATLIPTQRVYLTCNNVVPNSYYPTNSNLPIIGEVNLQAGYGVYSLFQSSDYYYHDLNANNSLTSLSFSLLNDKYEPIKTINGGSVNLSLLIKKL